MVVKNRRPFLELLLLDLTSFMLRLGPRGAFTGDEIIFSTFDHSHLLFEITSKASQNIPGHKQYLIPQNKTSS